ncbi:hypothetical protein LEP1GSC021_1425 [Leptospira noguchii str. 1993005606]|uniref:Uncharacterized protein n=1 Tax=Leptospira noguchii str. 2007001578 TaxID=1049974 RepID=A0ABP2T3K3_9LEPT|nr:hypothetical protein LEP1GSC035_3472 [Leptospira noguchii str. 2007001578]EPE83067.1 hypothetical protein LEP1GSC021_1425 [Leptospira noguchii str. 1993005606]
MQHQIDPSLISSFREEWIETSNEFIFFNLISCLISSFREEWIETSSIGSDSFNRLV